MSDTTDDLAAWLRAQLDEDERVARAANPGPWRRITGRAHLDPRSIFGADRPGNLERLRNVAQLDYSWRPDENAAHITRWDPARVLAEVAAKRDVLDAFRDAYPGDDTVGLERAVVLLAQPYAGRPGWRDECTTR